MNMYVIAGCNGAGKTTASYSILPEMLECSEFVNSDEIAKELSTIPTKSVKFEATRIMLERMRSLIENGSDFAFETTLATKTFEAILNQAKEKGYKITLVFFWLDTPELAYRRVQDRVAQGGHDVPKDVVYRRYLSGMRNFSKIYMHIADYWMIINNSNNPFILVADGAKGTVLNTYVEDVFNKIIIDGTERN
ncbi:MAG: zeta toxin family protein [Bacteroidales bacterium]|nr:zeta toxin family protein [Bacteroidales bacterium]